MPRTTKAEYEDLIEKTRGKLPASQPGEEFDLPPASERIRRLTQIQCHIQLDILMAIQRIDRKLGKMKPSLPYGVTAFPPPTKDKGDDPPSI